MRVYARVLSLNKFWWCYFRCGGSGFGLNFSFRSLFFSSKERCYNHFEFRDPSANDSSIIQQHIWIFSHCLNSLREVVRVLLHRLMELPSLRLYFVEMFFFVLTFGRMLRVFSEHQSSIWISIEGQSGLIKTTIEIFPLAIVSANKCENQFANGLMLGELSLDFATRYHAISEC